MPCVINLNGGNNVCTYGEVNLNSEYDISDDLLNFTLEPFKHESALLNNCVVVQQHSSPENNIVSNATSSHRSFQLDSTVHSSMNSTYPGAPLSSSSPSSASSSPEYFVTRNDAIVEPDTSIDDRCTERSNYVGVVPCLSNSASRDSTSSDSVDEFRNPNVGRFQYVLCAATSVAMKLNEESLTYLNQGQPYEIKLKKLGDLASCKGKVFKSVIRILFHDRRLRYIEREQMNAWQLSRPGDRLIEIDKPLSYGLLDTIEDPKHINSVQLLWDPTKEVGVFIKVNCISTEFTAKKHGGEKGVSFRLHIETYIDGHQNPRSLHSGSCQIKVFKLKGADRKHKQDREKVMKKPLMDREKYQQSYDCTVFTEAWLNETLPSPVLTTAAVSSAAPSIGFKETDRINGITTHISEHDKNPLNGQDVASSNSVSSNNIMLTTESSSVDIQQWLRLNRFGEHSQKFENFTAADMFNLSKKDYINLCGLSDGIRLYNTLPILPRLTLYINVVDSSDDYYPVYLKSLTCQELTNNIAPLAGLHPSQVHSVYILGPHGCKIIVTDSFVHNIKDETFFTLKLISDGEGNQSYNVLLKIVTTSSVTIPISQQSVA